MELHVSQAYVSWCRIMIFEDKALLRARRSGYHHAAFER